MAEVIAVGSILASGASTVAGMAGASTVFGISAGTLSTIGTGLGLASNVIGGIQEYQTIRNQAKAEETASEERAADIRLQVQQERTQQAIEQAEREKRLRRALASQRASFAGAGIDPNTGSPLNIQQQTTGLINREQRLSDEASSFTQSVLNLNAEREVRGGYARASGLRSKATTSLISTFGKVSGGISDLSEVI